jgi:inosine-uridine nucleoside N-ribohydrolase
MQASSRTPPVGVVFDCDIGNGIDDVLALAVLYGLDTKNETRVVSVSVSKGTLKAAALCDAIVRFYASGGSGRLSPFSRVLPVGFAEDGKTPEETKLLTETLARRDAQAKPVFTHAIHSLNDTAEPAALIRNALTAQHDQNAIAVLTGPATNLAKVLGVRGAKEWIERKVRYLVIAGGEYPSGDPDFNFATDIGAAQRVLAEWPSAIVTCGREVRTALQYPASSIESGFAWAAAAHPVVEAYRTFQAMPYDAPAGEAASILYAVRPHETYFKLSEPGFVRIRDDGGTEFTPAANGKHRHLILDPAQKERVVKTLAELASTKPVIRRPRFLQMQQNDPPKPPEAKPPKPTSKP